MFFFCVIISAVTISMMPYFIVHYLGNEVWVFLVAPILGMLASQVAPHVVVALKKVVLASFWPLTFEHRYLGFDSSVVHNRRPVTGHVRVWKSGMLISCVAQS